MTLRNKPPRTKIAVRAMKRRDFNRCTLGMFGGFILPATCRGFGVRSPMGIDSQRLMKRFRILAEFGRTSGGGTTRVAFSDADLEGRRFLMELMRGAQLEVRIDAAGNIIGRRAGPSQVAAPVLMFGSHIDSVPDGGSYDGGVGSIGAIEVAQTLADKGIGTRHPLEVVIFSNEEGGKTGSRSMCGEVQDKELDLVTHSGHTIRKGIELVGGNPARLDSVRRRPGDIAAFVELHIEQGGILHKRGIDIGVVEGIVGIKRWVVSIEGFANHAGTTAMNSRKDALLVAAKVIQAINGVVTTVPGRHVGTVGQIKAIPGAPNVIPGQVIMSLELRDLDMAKIEVLYTKICADALKIAREGEVAVNFVETYKSQAALTDEQLREIISDSAASLGLTTLRMPSGAGHDAQSIAQIAPVGMIFIPSVDGISHSPREFSRPDDLAAGANVLLNTLLALDSGNSPRIVAAPLKR